MADPPRPAEVLQALRRLAYKDKPQFGKHFDLYKLLKGHPEGDVTIHTSLDMGRPLNKRHVREIKKQTHLKGNAWDRALRRELPLEEYDEMLRRIPKPKLVNPWYEQLFDEPAQDPGNQGQGNEGEGRRDE